MASTRHGIGRIVATGIALALAMLLVLAAEAGAGKYTVAQCGWYVGADADWADTTGGAKFRPDSYCVPPGTDPFAGVHVKSLTRAAEQTVSGNRYARWRWTAPVGVQITQVRGTWWQALHDGIEQRLGGITATGFAPSLIAGATNTAPRSFVIGFPVPVPAIEDRLLCARAESKWCSLAAGSWSGLRALTITAEDISPPAAGIGGELVAGGWLRGARTAAVWGGDVGSGIRYGATYLDGNPVARTDYACAMALIGGEWRATRMRPCELGVSAHQAIATNAFSDGPHSLYHCVFGFDGDAGCTAVHTVHFDNTAPAHPRSLALAGGDGWRRSNDFDLSWANPGQGAASPIAGASWRLRGAAGYDTGVRFAAGRDRTTLADLKVPGPGSYPLALWLRDEAGNEAPASAITVPLRFDDVPPSVGFLPADGSPPPPLVEAEITDAHSGPAAGTIHYRRVEAAGWTELPTKLLPASASSARLRAPLPDLGPGTYVFRADVADAAGNTASTGRRADGAEMTIRRLAAAEAVAVPAAPQRKTRLFARLGGRGRGQALTVPFGAAAKVEGRLTRADGAGISGREIRIVARPSRGALAPRVVAAVTSGERGGFELRLGPGPSRRVTVAFRGDNGLEPSRRRPLELRVRGGVSLHAARSELSTGQALRLSGRVRSRGAAVPRRGKLVAVQYLEEATGRWRPVLFTRSDHDGHFRARYRFRYVSGAARIRLRATALAEERWPYAPGSSRPVTVDVSAR